VDVMSKWRPSPLNCIYVIPDIHGCYSQLQLICNRILPLRKSDGGHDKLIFLGDYIDRGENTPAVLDLLIQIQQQYGDQVVFLRGNHEEMMLAALDRLIIEEPDPLMPSYYSMWIQNGGALAISQYLEQQWQSKEDPFIFPRNRLPDLIPKEHVEFLESTQYFYEFDRYIFVHAGCDPTKPLEQQNQSELVWDRALYNFARYRSNLPWDKTVVTGHNYNGPFINENFMMLDCSANRQLMAVELNSMEACIAKPGKKRLIKKLLSETKVRTSFQRADA
jgi:serine/threonine protein phosphatase 1